MKIPSTPKVRPTQLVGQSKQAPGLKTRQTNILHKALGISPEVSISPLKLASVAQYHPDPKVQKAAANMLSKLDFNMNPIKGR